MHINYLCGMHDFDAIHVNTMFGKQCSNLGFVTKQGEGWLGIFSAWV